MPRNKLQPSDPYAKERQGGSELLKQYPKVAGFLDGFMGVPPDEVGSVFDDPDLRSGAETGFRVGTVAGVAPLLKALGLTTRTGRNVARAIKPGGTSPLVAAMEELSRSASPYERAIAVSKRGVAGPVRVGTVGGVRPGRSSSLADALEDFHTHPAGADFYGLHPGDVAQSKRSKTTVLHTTPEGQMTGRSESLADPQSHLSPLEQWSYADPKSYRDWLALKGKYTTDVPEDLYNREAWGDLMPSGEFMASPMDATYKALKRLQPADMDLAMSRAESLPQHIDPSRYSPAALARISALEPAAQRGFSESMIPTRPPFAASLMRPSEFLERTPPMADDLTKLKASLEKNGVKELPALWLDQRAGALEAGHEGRHRMKALLEMYGDDPVLMSLIQGNKFEPSTDFLGRPYQKLIEELNLTPMELLQQQIKFGDRPLDISPLWTK